VKLRRCSQNGVSPDRGDVVVLLLSRVQKQQQHRLSLYTLFIHFVIPSSFLFSLLFTSRSLLTLAVYSLESARIKGLSVMTCVQHLASHLYKEITSQRKNNT
jgi:hypothetical protein